ncbi:MAG: D-aminoacyl-tRNA deacylase [Myxococcota bacterium]|nr:D-aminoacyl-tRNA deacylase [Myxococcota bacterium]
MRAVVQRVSRATVSLADEAVSEMGAGLLCLVAARKGDELQHADAMAQKLVHLRVFPDDEGRMNLSLLETGGELGVVSQFTLYADCSKGRRPFFGEAATHEVAEPLIERIAQAAQAEGVRVVTGRFGAHMEVALTNVGPVTLLVDI